MNTKKSAAAVIAMVTLLASFAMAQKGKYVESTYDKFKDETSVQIKLMSLRSSLMAAVAGSLSFSANFKYPGQKFVAPAEVNIRFRALEPAPQYMHHDDNRALQVLADDARFDLGTMAIVDYGKGKAFTADSGAYVEDMQAPMPMKDFLQMAKASKVTMRLGSKVIELKGKFLDALKELAAEIGEGK